MKTPRVWVTRDRSIFEICIWKAEPRVKDGFFGEFQTPIAESVQNFLRIKPGEIREFRLVPVAKKKGGRE